MERFKNLIINLIVERPKWFIAIGILTLLPFLPSILRIQSDFSAKVWYQKTDPNIKVLEKFEREFGSNETVIIVATSPKGIFNPKGVDLISKLTEEMWMTPEVERVDSLTNFHWTLSKEDEIITEPFLDEDFIKRGSLETFKKRELEARNHPVIKNYLLSQDGEAGAIYGRLSHNPDKAPSHEKIVAHLKEKIKVYQEAYPGFSFYIMGPPFLRDNFQKSSYKDILSLVPLCLSFLFILLFTFFKGVMGIVIPLAVIGSSLIPIMGIMGLFGIKLNSLTNVLPSVIIAIGVADTVHVMSTFKEYFSLHGDVKKAAKDALEKNFYPIFLTSISTAIGFFGLTTSKIQPVQDLGLLAGIGTLFACYFSYVFIVPLIYWGRWKKEKFVTKSKWIENFTFSLFKWVSKFKVKILVIFSLTTVFCFYMALQNEINSNPYKFFKDNHPVTVGNDLILKKFGGILGPEILIDSGTSEGIKDPAFLKRVEEFQLWINQRPFVNKSLSIIDSLKEVNRALFNGKKEEYRIHPKRDVIAQELFLYTLGLPEGLGINDRLDLKNQILRLSILWNVQDSESALEKVQMLEEKGKNLGLKIQVTGKSLLFQQMNSYIVSTFFNSMGMALLLITLLLMVVFRSLKIGLMSLIPNFIPLILGGGILKLSQTPIDMGCAIVASVTLGIAVDDTIHFLSHYKRLLKEGFSPRDAVFQVYSSTGKALFITTLILVTSFGLFIFASLVPNVNFGVLSSFVLSMALLCDLIILPALILTIWGND